MVTDDGCGGADPQRGSGLLGLERRLGTFDGILAVNSPPGGPTIIAIEVPCALSSRRISISSRDGLTRLLDAHGFDVTTAVGTAPELLSALLDQRPDVAVIDVRLPPTFTDEGLRTALEAQAPGARPAGPRALGVRRTALRP